MPEGAVYVGRPSRWGNPYVVGDLFNGGNISPEEAVALYRRALLDGRLQNSVARVRRELTGKCLACWCAPPSPCHAEVLIELANQ